MGYLIYDELSFWESILAWLFAAAATIFIIYPAMQSLRRRGGKKTVSIRAAVRSKPAEKYVNQPVFMQDKQVNRGESG